MTVSLVVGCPVWDRAWALDTWFDSVEANCDPEDTGLCFVVPPADYATREAIARRSEPFAWCEVLRDRNPAHDRLARQADNHLSLAVARNQILQQVQRVGPRHYLSWDSDLFVEPGLVPELCGLGKPVVTVWTWLNRARPRRVRHFRDPESAEWLDVLVEPPMCATAMEWDEGRTDRAHHLDPARWHECASGLWEADVALAFKLMSPGVYAATHYGPHPHGEDIVFARALARRGIRPWCYGDSVGVHLALDKAVAQGETQDPYPKIMALAEQIPLAATHEGERDEDLVTLGYFPIPTEDA